MTKRNIAIAGAVLLCLGYGIGRYVQPPKEVTHTEVEEREVIRKDVTTIVREVTRPDGTKEIVTEIVDKTKEKKESRQETTISKPVEKQWHAAVGLERELSSTTNIYSVTVERRVFLDAYVGLRVNTEKQVGITVGYEF